MKFPMSERPFASVALSPPQCDEYEKLLQTVVDATYEERERFVHLDNRRLSKKLWKAVKTRDDVTVYKRLGRDAANLGALRGPVTPQPAESYHWRMPKMIAVGTIAGSLDDIMYGIVTPDAPSIVVKTSYVHDELVDSAVLHEIRGATREDPFQWRGLKWMVKAHTQALNAVVWPRDFVFVEATGVRTYRDGSRMGYHAMHSVDHPLCRELETLGLVRAKMSSCYLYFQRTPGTVEVYMMTFVEPGGNAPETIGVLSAANTMIGIWKSVWCAQNKMLAYLLENDAAKRRFRAASSLATTVPGNHQRCCHLCNKVFRSFRTVTACQLCSAWVCSKCRIARTLSASNATLELLQRVVEVCKSCIAHVAVADTYTAAVDQYVAASQEPVVQKPVAKTEPPTKSLEPEDDAVERQRECSTESSATLPGSLTSLGNFGRIRSWREDEEGDDDAPPSRSRETSEAESVVLETIDDWAARHTVRVVASASAPVTSAFRPSATSIGSSAASDYEDDEDHQQRLLRQMQSLCLAAEQTYQITSLTASRVLESKSSTTRKHAMSN